MHPNALLIETGLALYGERWQTDMARALAISDRTVRRWAAGTETPRAGVYADLLRICEDRSENIGAIAKRLKDVAARA